MISSIGIYQQHILGPATACHMYVYGTHMRYKFSFANNSYVIVHAECAHVHTYTAGVL